VVYIIFAILILYDRFYSQLWPREWFWEVSKDSKKIKEGPWSVKLRDICVKVSARLLLHTCNTSFWLAMNTTHKLFENICINKMVDFGD
jgi:hypothetical protein